MVVKKIEVLKEFDFEELEKRLRRVSLRGFPDIKIYGNSDIRIRSLSPEQVRDEIFTPQPSVYKTELNKVSQVAEIFSQSNINIFKLNGGIDYLAFDEKGEVTEWTIIPSVIEILPIKFGLEKGLDYTDAVGPELNKVMKEKGYKLNPEVNELDFPEYKMFNGGTEKISEICDGSHRIELGIRGGLEQNLLFTDFITLGFPYYAAPKPYSCIHEEAERIEEKIDKTHVLTSPGHKLLYRLFPSGGINSGNVRPLKQPVD